MARGEETHYNLGSDSELILFKNTKQAPTVAAEHIFSNHDKVAVICPREPYGSYHSDGRQAEISPNASYCREFHADYTWRCLSRLRQALLQLSPKTEILMVPGACEKMTRAAILRGGANCIQSGCNPDFSAYAPAIQPNHGVEDYLNLRRVLAGLHIHYTFHDTCSPEFERREDVKMMDRLVALPVMLLLRDVADAERERRKYYGKAGCYRSPKYGREYRTLSGYALASPALFSFALGCARTAAALVEAGRQKDFLVQITDDEIQEAINEVNIDLGYRLWDRVLHLLKGTSTLNYGAPSPLYQATSSAVRNADFASKAHIIEFCPLIMTDYLVRNGHPAITRWISAGKSPLERALAFREAWQYDLDWGKYRTHGATNGGFQIRFLMNELLDKDPQYRHHAEKVYPNL